MFYAGMLSKSKGQILRVAVAMHVLFYMETPNAIFHLKSVKLL